jgi:L-lactate dehydrogenase complex protein LldF
MTGFDERIIDALEDQELRENLRGAMDFLQSKLSLSINNSAQWEHHQELATRVRHALPQQLPTLLEQLEQSCTRNGINVHWAFDAKEAREIFLQIAQQKSATKVIKGKSMASEEIELNHHLEDHGIESTESDMGEFIVQLANEKPSHIIMPALHKNQDQIAELFKRQLGEDADANDVDQLIGIGRKVLREKFKNAEIGVSGVNFAAANSGTLCLVENEGNGRMSTSIPNCHIAIMGIDKVIPDLSSLPSLLYLLTRSATGQDITTYLNLISGPRKTDELDGPESVHLIILDNGRSAIACEPKLNATLACIRCGACMNHCPVYTKIGGHAYGTTYPGPIGQVISPQLDGGNQHNDLLKACSLNGACGEACPVNIELPELIRQLRTQRSGDQPFSVLEKIVWSIWQKIHRSPALYRLSSSMMRLPGLSSFLFPRAWTKGREAPKPARKTLHSLIKERKQKGGRKHGND